jgi:hypothetical protein
MEEVDLCKRSQCAKKMLTLCTYCLRKFVRCFFILKFFSAFYLFLNQLNLFITEVFKYILDSELSPNSEEERGDTENLRRLIIHSV